MEGAIMIRRQGENLPIQRFGLSSLSRLVMPQGGLQKLTDIDWRHALNLSSRLLVPTRSGAWERGSSLHIDHAERIRRTQFARLRRAQRKNVPSRALWR